VKEKPMHSELLSQSPLLALPLVSLFLFATVYLGVSLRAFLTSRGALDAAAGLPFAEESEALRET
jgi:hypothetical protein